MIYKFFKYLNKSIEVLMLLLFLYGMLGRYLIGVTEYAVYGEIFFSVGLILFFCLLPFFNFYFRGMPYKDSRNKYWDAVKGKNYQFFFKRIILIYGLYLFIYCIYLLSNKL